MLGRLVTLSRERGYSLALVVFPLEMQLGPEVVDLYQRQFRLVLDPDVIKGEAQRRLREFAARHDVPMIDLLPAFRATSAGPR
jgi:hypothetical protein